MQVNYKYNDTFYDGFSFEELGKAIKFDVNAVLDYVLADKSYENYYLIGKSLGTIAMGSLLDRDGFENAKAIWMTPLIHRDDVLNEMVRCKNKGLCIIGDKDPCYSKERYDRVVENSNITPRLIPLVNHSLQYDEEPVKSIDVLKSIVSDIELF